MIKKIIAREILDSRGNPTLEVDVFTENHFGRVAVPSGASTGTHEACELRDNDKTRFNGKGVLKAVSNVNNIIQNELIGDSVLDQTKIDNKLKEIDNTKNKSFLGANAILGVSLAISKVAALEKGISLYEYYAYISGNKSYEVLPMPMMNIINGGKHSDSGLSIQEFMIVPTGANSFSESIRFGAEVFHRLKNILKADKLTVSVGDEGGFAPQIKTHEAVLDYIVKAIDECGYTDRIKIALDAAASEFYIDGKYKIDNGYLNSNELTSYYEYLVNKYPIISIEDSHSEDDFDGFKSCMDTLGDKIQLVGDDLFVTNTERIKMGITDNLANSVLIKPNQIGTLTETIEAINLAKDNGLKCIVSHRSGETEDTTISDLSVGLNTGQIKTGSVSRTDRVCKYNQLIRIEESLGDKSIFSSPF